ncbi:endo-1,4-beta-xylanase [Paenibacillus sp. LHD-117]|uniref:endo-1,4-beta-xylanase n=1 Tax=Paenibacillus sp. LHD-117 TaxID=3071412 RepID=UPI0027E1C3CE|nr:endo-1,4-beta-xylanase [Paenibacillus sp. LHD-117]MDQ6417894.1 endo-1,4-beta-xylanase [Paenibacillus sp. LHD-117]
MVPTRNSELHALREAYKHKFLIGAAVNPTTMNSQRELLARHFNSITAENEMKFERLHPEENRYTFEHADNLMAFAKENGMAVRGHTLVWHNQTPDWVFENRSGELVDRNTLLGRMKAHIDTVVSRYKGEIYAWDVVNEAVADSGGELLRPSKWLEIVGKEFIAKAFEYAHAADPKALLFYNDYNESVPEKRDKIYALVKWLKESGVPIHGIGLQAHWNLEHPSLSDIRQAIEMYASLGLKLHITELDVSVFKFEDKRTDLTLPTEEMLEIQSKRYEQFFQLFREYRDCITSVTFWGAADDYTWLDHFPVRNRKNWPFVFDLEHQPKQSYWKLLEVARS